MPGIKIAIIGAGSSYTPELIDGFIRNNHRLQIRELALMDNEPFRLNLCYTMAEKMIKGEGSGIRLSQTPRLGSAVEGADFVINQIRVGGLDARIKDEKIPLRYDLLGQETTGAGGFANGLRTIPVVIEIARTVEKYSPECWFLNFTNPSGMVTQALTDNTKLKVLGLCNGPLNMLTAVRNALKNEDFNYEFIGLNHLCWITSVISDGLEIIDDLYHGSFESGSRLKNIPEMEYPAGLLSASGGLPIGYLKYYYFRHQQILAQKKENKTRGEICRELENELFSLYGDPAVVKKPVQLAMRGGAQYSEMALNLIRSIVAYDKKIHIVNTKNKGAYSFLEDNDVVEVKAICSPEGVETVEYRGPESLYIEGMMRTVKAYEKLTIKAALEGDEKAALAALMVHPLVGDYDKASAVLKDILVENKDFLPKFNRKRIEN